MISSFGFSVKELLDIDILKDAKILSGIGGIERRIIKMNVMEVPDIVDWVTKGEFLLTTAYSIKDDINKLGELIIKLDEKGIAGIGIKTKRYIDKIPDETLKISNRLNFPIIEIPYDISFSEIIMPALAEIINKQTSTLTNIYEFHNSLINLIVKGGSLQEIASAIHKNIGNPVVICEKIFKTHVVATSKELKDITNIVFEKNEKWINDTDEIYYKIIDDINGRKIDRLIIPIKVDETIYGYINIWEFNHKLTPMEINVVISSTSIIALDLLKKLSIFKIENKYKSEFFDDLLSGDENKLKKVYENKIFYDFKHDLSYSVIIVNIKGKVEQNGGYYIENLMKIIDKVILKNNKQIICANKRDRIIILISNNKIDGTVETDSMKKQIADDIIKLANEEFEKNEIIIGIGRSYDEINEIVKSYNEAKRVIEFLKTRTDIFVTNYNDLGIFRILSYSEIKPELLQFYSDILEPLVIYDKERGQELVNTLVKYFEHRGNIKKISDEMYTHYNTIVYRMNRIEKIAKIDFKNPNNYLDMQIAIKIYEILKK